MQLSIPALAASTLSAATSLAAAAPASDQNLLVVVADDLGVDMLACYGVGTDLPTTPTLDALAAGGLRFDDAWSYPVCSPARAAMMTGRHGHRTGIGKAILTDT